MSILRRRAITGAQGGGGGPILDTAWINFDLFTDANLSYKIPPKLDKVTNIGTGAAIAKYISNRGSAGDNVNYVAAEKGLLYPGGDQNISCPIDDPGIGNINVELRDRSWFFVTNPISTSGLRMIGISFQNSIQFRYESSNNSMLYYSNQGGSRITSGAVTSGVRNLFELYSTSSGFTLVVDGVINTFGPLNINDGFSRVGTGSGGAFGLNGYLNQVVVFDSTLTNPERVQAVSELKTRWNINHFKMAKKQKEIFAEFDTYIDNWNQNPQPSSTDFILDCLEEIIVNSDPSAKKKDIEDYIVSRGYLDDVLSYSQMDLDEKNIPKDKNNKNLYKVKLKSWKGHNFKFKSV